jgi:hypothetical protein
MAAAAAGNGWMDRYKTMDGGGMDVHQFNSCLMIFDDVVAV